MSLKEKREKKERELKEAEENAAAKVPDMKPCAHCHKEKRDAVVRPALYPTDAQGNKVSLAYVGILCDDCFKKAEQKDPRVNQWMLRQVGLARPGRPLSSAPK